MINLYRGVCIAQSYYISYLQCNHYCAAESLLWHLSKPYPNVTYPNVTLTLTLTPCPNPNSGICICGRFPVHVGGCIRRDRGHIKGTEYLTLIHETNRTWHSMTREMTYTLIAIFSLIGSTILSVESRVSPLSKTRIYILIFIQKKLTYTCVHFN